LTACQLNVSANVVFSLQSFGSHSSIFRQVTSSNAGGESQSEWIVARSGEGLPETVPAPFNEQSASATQIMVEWRRPQRANGVTSNYTLTAVELERLESSDGGETVCKFGGKIFLAVTAEAYPLHVNRFQRILSEKCGRNVAFVFLSLSKLKKPISYILRLKL